MVLCYTCCIAFFEAHLNQVTPLFVSGHTKKQGLQEARADGVVHTCSRIVLWLHV